jgi:hypothetical protein
MKFELKYHKKEQIRGKNLIIRVYSFSRFKKHTIFLNKIIFQTHNKEITAWMLNIGSQIQIQFKIKINYSNVWMHRK